MLHFAILEGLLKYFGNFFRFLLFPSSRDQILAVWLVLRCVTACKGILEPLKEINRIWKSYQNIRMTPAIIRNGIVILLYSKASPTNPNPNPNPNPNREGGGNWPDTLSDNSFSNKFFDKEVYLLTFLFKRFDRTHKTVRSSHQKCSLRKGVLKNFGNFPRKHLFLIKFNGSSHQRCSISKGVLRNCATFPGKQLCQVSCLQLKKKTGTVVICKFCKISKNTFLQNIFKQLLLIAGIQACDFSKKILRHRCFPVNIRNFYKQLLTQRTTLNFLFLFYHWRSYL